MAIREFLPFSRPLYGDGEATTVTLDFADQIAASPVCCGDPEEVKDVCPADTKATVSGTKVTFEFASAPDGPFSVAGELLFSHKDKGKSKAKEDDEDAKDKPKEHAKPHHR